MYLFERQNNKKRNRDRAFPLFGSFPTNCDRAESGGSQEPEAGSRSPSWVAGAQAVGSSSAAFPGTVGGS